MPIYEFECPDGHRFEKIMSLENGIQNGKWQCGSYEGGVFCGKWAERIWSIPANINLAKPTIIFRNPKTNEVEVATHDNDQPRKGFVREELKNPIERSKFEKEQSQQRYVEDEIVSEAISLERSQTDKNRHADINARMGSYDSQTQQLLKSAMKRSAEKKKRTPRKQTNIRLDVNHIDQSNLK